MSDFDPFSMLMGDEATAKAIAKARADALRAQSDQGTVLSLMRNAPVQAAGQNMVKGAAQGLENLGTEGATRMRFGPQAALGGITSDAYGEITKRRLANENWEFKTNPDTGDAYMANRRSGKVVPLDQAVNPNAVKPPAYGEPGYVEKPIGKVGQTLIEKFKKDLDTGNASPGSPIGQNQGVVNRATRLRMLLQQTNGDIRNLDKREQEEFAMGMQAILSGSNRPIAAQVKALVPDTALGNVLKFKEWLFNQPEGLQQQEFTKRSLSMLDREQQAAQTMLNSARAQRFPGNLRLLQRYPQAAANEMQAAGYDPKDVDFKTGLYKPKPQQDNEPTSAGGSSGTVKIREKATGKTRSFPAEKAKQILADPRFEQAP